jgi:hypothetical protein
VRFVPLHLCDCRHQGIVQELQARQLPPNMQTTYMELAGLAARHLRNAQVARARQLADFQALELTHASANFERGIKMSESRHELEMQHFSVR